MAGVTTHTDTSPAAARATGSASADAPATAPPRPGVAPATTTPSAAPGRTARPAPTPKPSGQKGHSRLPRLLLLVVLAAIVSVTGWWAYTTQPWIRAAAPLTASGTLEADEVLVGTEVSGRIVGLAREGDAIEANTVVARLDDSLVRLQIRQSDAATQQQLAIQADKYLLRSPISGVVTRVPVHTGEVAAPGQTVVAVSDLSTLDLMAYVLERDLGQVRVGQVVSVTADPFPGRVFYGVVVSTNQRAEFTPRNVQTQRDRLNLVFGVKIRVDNPDGSLKPGMPADATFAPL
jgi:multidrug resistance efflux pump